MRNLNLRFVSGVAAAIVGSLGLAHGQEIRVVVDGERVQFRGQPPIEMNDRVLVPLRGVLEDLGAQVNWNPSDQTVTARRGDTRIRLTIGQRTASVDDRPVDLDVPAQIIDGSTMVPLRFMSEALGEQVHWEAQTQTVSIFQDHDYAFDRDEHRPRRRRDDDGQDEQEAPPQRIVVLDADTVLPTEIRMNIRRWRPGDRITTTVQDFPNLPPNCEVSGVVTAIGSTYYDQPREIGLHFDTLTFPDGRKLHIDGTGVPLRSRTVVAPGDADERAEGFTRLYRSERVGIRLNRPLRIREMAPPTPDSDQN